MQKINPPIVVIAFNRSRSLNRLLDSLKDAHYPNDKVTLIISIDKAENNHDVLQLAEKYAWKFGQKKVVYQSENLGLRKHVMKCASYSKEYGNVILLEDDLYVSPLFYDYACQSLEFSRDKGYIGGISLYNHQFNVNAKVNFSPMEDGYDNWYFQFASSWGQAWTKEQWNAFSNWYSTKKELTQTPTVPQNITRWSDKSWLKYFIHYLVEVDKYFIYPKISLSTNFSDSGTHIGTSSAMYQVPLHYFRPRKYEFSELNDSKSIYDVFFENRKLYQAIQIGSEDLCVDLYGTKPVNHLKQHFLLSTRIHNFKIIRTFGRRMKPIDANVFHGIKGNDIFLYDTKVKEQNPYKNSFYPKIAYYHKYISRRNAKKLFLHMYSQRLVQFFKDNLRF